MDKHEHPTIQMYKRRNKKKIEYITSSYQAKEDERSCRKKFIERCKINKEATILIETSIPDTGNLN